MYSLGEKWYYICDCRCREHDLRLATGEVLKDALGAGLYDADHSDETGRVSSEDLRNAKIGFKNIRWGAKICPSLCCSGNRLS